MTRPVMVLQSLRIAGRLYWKQIGMMAAASFLRSRRRTKGLDGRRGKGAGFRPAPFPLPLFLKTR
jgi:hypothetical protein